MIRANFTRKDSTRDGKIVSTRVEADLGRATKFGVEALGKAVVQRAQRNAQRSISHSKPYNRPHRGGHAEDMSYFDAWQYVVTGSRLTWKVTVTNQAPDQMIQEDGKRGYTSMPNLKNARIKRILRGWAEDRGILKGVFVEQSQRRGKTGRFLRKRFLSEKQVLYAIAKGIGKNARPANKNLQRAYRDVDLELRGGRMTDFVRGIEAALRS